MENTFYKAEKFNEILEKVAGESLFGIEEDGSLNTTVHTGKTIEAFTMKVEFPDNSILITTRAFLKAKERNYDRVKALLESINKDIKYGVFFLDKKNILSFSVKSDFDLISSLDNPFDFVFYGCETFEKYTESILKVLSGSTVFYMSVP
jgi:hypothetical protein